MSERPQQTFDCAPTMSDREVLAFCRDGYLMLEGVVPADVNDRVTLYCDEHGGEAPVHEGWYLQGVTLNPILAGVVRSLLGIEWDRFLTHQRSPSYMNPTVLGTRLVCRNLRR